MAGSTKEPNAMTKQTKQGAHGNCSRCERPLTRVEARDRSHRCGKQAHTPTKELFFKPTASHTQGEIYGEDGRTIAVIYDRKDGYGQLFAAAPELLEALKRSNAVLKEMGFEVEEDQEDFMGDNERAIAKVEGR